MDKNEHEYPTKEELARIVNESVKILCSFKPTLLQQAELNGEQKKLYRQLANILLFHDVTGANELTELLRNMPGALFLRDALDVCENDILDKDLISIEQFADWFNHLWDIALEMEATAPHVKPIKETVNFLYPTDPASKAIFRPHEPDMYGEWREAIDVGSDGREALILVGTYFDKLTELQPNLDAFDKRVFLGYSALTYAGYDCFSVSAIHKQIGKDYRPGSGDIDAINKSLTKMSLVRVVIDNTSEYRAGRADNREIIDAPLISFSRRTVFSEDTGEILDGYIQILGKPALMEFAIHRRQIILVSRNLLASSGSMTKKKLELTDYLLTRVAAMKTRKTKMTPRILYETLYNKFDVKNRQQKERLRKKAHEELDHFRNEGYIKGYTSENQGITIKL